jgi:hypothetical protein
MDRLLRIGYRAARRIVVAVVGGTVVLIGVAMLVLPGPALVVIPVGLAILSIEFAWARHWLRKVKEAASQAAARVNGNGNGNDAGSGPGPSGGDGAAAEPDRRDTGDGAAAEPDRRPDA